MTLNLERTRNLLQYLDFQRLFIEELGWSRPPANSRALRIAVDGEEYACTAISQLAGVVVFEVTSNGGPVPSAKVRRAIHRQISAHHHENLLIFVNQERTQGLWYWVKRQGDKGYPREHLYVQGQPGDLILGKLQAMVVDLADLEQGSPTVLDAAQRLSRALDVQRVTKKFYEDFKAQHVQFLSLIEGIPDENDRRWYASVILNRLMFVYFLQRKRFIDDNYWYLQDKLAESQRRGPDRFYGEFLQALFYEGFAKPEDRRSDAARGLMGNVRYLNGGLFLRHQLEQRYTDIVIPDAAFENILKLFEKYSWNLNDVPGESDDEINPDVLGYIFEKYINQKSYGAYYTRPEITGYLCERTVHKLILDQINTEGIPGVTPPRHFASINELLMRLDANLCRSLLDVLGRLSLLDPACGSGAFLVSAMKALINIYSAVIGKIKFLGDRNLSEWLRKAEQEHPSLQYYVKKKIITDNLYGVDLMEEATEIAKLRLFLALVSSVDTADDLEPLPNIDFNIMQGNSLIGVLDVDPPQMNLFYGKDEYRRILTEKNRLIDDYRHTATLTRDLQALRDNIQDRKRADRDVLNDILLQNFLDLGVKYEQVDISGRARKRTLRKEDISALEPFHWGYEFDQILETRGGFDAIITNPPWDIFKPQAKEFFAQYSNLVTKKKMDIKSFETHQNELLKDPEIAAAWCEYMSYFPHQSAYYRSAEQYKNQISVVNGKKAGTDINLYKLFLEQCYNLLRPGGQCGIVIPSGIYTDLGTKQLREMLFESTEVTGLFGFENRKGIFEGVDSRFKFVVLTFEKGGVTTEFPAAFMRLEVKELEHFPEVGSLPISVELVRRLSPDSLSVMEFKSEMDVRIAEKMLRFPLLGEKIEGTWNLKLTAEFHMTNDSHLFRTSPGPGRLPLYEGKMIHQFTHQFAAPRYWVDEAEGRKAILGRRIDAGQKVDYQYHRLGFRAVASSTNERSLISTVVPSQVFCGNSLLISNRLEDGQVTIDDAEMVFCSTILNSFVVDYHLRQKVTTNLNMFFIYQLPVPRLGATDPYFADLVERAAKLTCTTPEYDELAREVGLGSHEAGVTDAEERARLRAELDGMVAHLYGLTEEEFGHVLSTFPLVPQATKDATMQAYRTLAPKPGDPEILKLIAAGESDRVEFKSTLRVDWPNRNANRDREKDVVKAVVAFLNTQGGTLLIGVEDNGNIVGLEPDYNTLDKKSWDGFALRLVELLYSTHGTRDLSQFIRFTRHVVDGKDVCRVDVQPSPEPVWVNLYKGDTPDLWVRASASSVKLRPYEAVKYVSQHWGTERTGVELQLPSEGPSSDELT